MADLVVICRPHEDQLGIETVRDDVSRNRGFSTIDHGWHDDISSDDKICGLVGVSCSLLVMGCLLK